MTDQDRLNKAIKNGEWIIESYGGVKRGDTFWRGKENFVIGGYNVVSKAFNAYPIDPKNYTIHMMINPEDVKKLINERNEKTK